MQSIRRSEVPVYLRGSKVFQSLEEQGEFEIPHEKYKSSPDIPDETAFRHLVSTIHFWDVTLFSNDEYKVAFEKKLQVFDSFGALLLDFQKTVQDCTMGAPGQRMVFQYWIDQGGAFSEYTLCLLRVAGAVRLEYMDCCVVEVKCKKSTLSAQPFLQWLASSAAQGGNVSVLRQLHAMGTVFSPSLYVDAIGSLECVRYLLDAKVRVLPTFIMKLAEQDQCAVLKCVLSQGCPIPLSICEHLRSAECVDVLIEAGFKWTEHSGYEALLNKQNDLQYVEALARMCELGCFMPSAAKTVAIRQNSMPMLKKLHEHGCKWDENGDCVRAAVWQKRHDMVKYAKRTGSVMPSMCSSDDNYDPNGI